MNIAAHCFCDAKGAPILVNVTTRAHVNPQASAAAYAGLTPVVDLDTGGVIALQAGGEGLGNISTTIQTVHDAAAGETLLPLVLTLPTAAVIGGTAALAPLHEALRASGRRPREVILTLRGDFAQFERRSLIVGLDGLRALGYLIAVGDLGTGHIPLDLLADAAPYLAVISPDLIAQVPRDPRRTAIGEGLARLAREAGAHVLASGCATRRNSPRSTAGGSGSRRARCWPPARPAGCAYHSRSSNRSRPVSRSAHASRSFCCPR